MEHTAFLSVFKELSSFIASLLPTEYEMPPSAVDWMNKLMDYNVPLGKLVRGLTVIDTARAVNGGALTPDQYKRAAVLGWCIEWLQAFFLVADDIMDESTMRRGQPCWYKHKNVGVIAVNDSFLLESHIYLILKKYFRQESYYTILMEIFHEVTFQTELGQLLDLTSQPADKSIDLTLFTEERYISIVKYKTSFYSFYVPVILGLVVGGVTATPDYETAFQTAKEICTKMGIYFQVQDDVLDCYGDPKIIGKVGTDIEDNKCSWLIVNALKLASPGQRLILESNYGKKDEECVRRVKDVYLELDVISIFNEYEERVHSELREQIRAVTVVPPECFSSLLDKIYKRKK